jgi:hypothetical protein
VIAHEEHNKLATDFVMKVGTGTRSVSEVCVVMETIILGAMHLLVGVHGANPSTASALVEAAVQQAVERFTDPSNQHKGPQS